MTSSASNNQNCINDHSHHETSFGSYVNHGQHAEVIQNTSIDNFGFSIPRAELEQYSSSSATFDSAARFDPPRCAESTRLGILQIIEEWVNSGNDAMQSSLFWLHGGAGVGKSALAQSLSEKFQKKQLAASFFFFRGDPTRNNGNSLIPTLVSQLIGTFKGILPFVEDRIRNNRAVFTKQYQFQIQDLLVEPLLALKSTGTLVTYPRLIVIDGLDECQNPDMQLELLRVIARAIPHIPYPLRFFITSRPEAHIAHLFKHDRGLQAIMVQRYNLSDDPDADMDIRQFLEAEFLEIRRVHRLGQHLPHDWPDLKTITSLVERSSGHFIYASTVIRYIRSLRHRPDDRLEVILRLRSPQEGDKPYAQLDALYALIFQGVESRTQLVNICLVLGILYFQSKNIGIFGASDSISIEKFLGMRAGDLVLLLDPILSLVVTDGDEVRILHKSLFDYLLDSTRGGHLPFDPARVHESAAIYIQKQWVIEEVCDIFSFRNFAYHCQYACLNDTLKNCLHSQEITCRKSIMDMAKISPWQDKLFESLPSAIWCFFRTLSREDFDSTHHVYEQYAVKWMGHLVKPKLDSLKSILRLKPGTEIAVYKLKRDLDTLLTKWTPSNFNSVPVAADLNRRVSFIKQEHSVFSACFRTAVNVESKATASSLIIGDHFIHSYNYVRGGYAGVSILILHTYSKHNNNCCRFACAEGTDFVVVQATSKHLRRVEKLISSDLYQKYGLEPDEDTSNTVDNPGPWNPVVAGTRNTFTR